MTDRKTYKTTKERKSHIVTCFWNLEYEDQLKYHIAWPEIIWLKIRKSADVAIV